MERRGYHKHNQPHVFATDVIQYEVHSIVYEIPLPEMFNLKLIKFSELIFTLEEI